MAYNNSILLNHVKDSIVEVYNGMLRPLLDFIVGVAG